MGKIERRRLFADIETSPNVVYTWRAGYKINIPFENIIEERKVICVSWKWEDEDEVHTLTWDKKQNDKALLKKFIKVLNRADEVIGHNFDRFDLKWLRGRALYHSIPMSPTYVTTDTLKLSRSLFSLNSNRLDYIAQYLGVGAKTKHRGWAMWTDVMDGSKKALAEMVTYCENDVIILENVYQKIKNYSKPRIHYATLSGLEKWNCPDCGTSHTHCNKTRTTAAGTVKREMKCLDKECGRNYTISDRAYVQYLKFKTLRSA